MEQSQLAQNSSGRRLATVLSLALVLGAGFYVIVSRGFSFLGAALFAISALLLLYLCWSPNRKAAAAAGVIAVGAIVYALPLGVVVSSSSFGAGLMVVGLVITAIRLP